jgi:hypothetical protein
VDQERSELRSEVERRLEFIELRLFSEGHVNRSDLTDQFGVSVNQASTDLNRYIGLAPDNMVYDKSARTYVRGPAFKPRFLEPDASLPRPASVGSGGDSRQRGRSDRRSPALRLRPDPGARRQSGDAPLGGRHPSLRGDRGEVPVAVQSGAALALDRSACRRVRRVPLALTGVLPEPRSVQGLPALGYTRDSWVAGMRSAPGG